MADIVGLVIGDEGCAGMQSTIDDVQQQVRSRGNIRAFLDEFVASSDNIQACVKCFDEAPDESQTCEERKLFGQCTQDWLIDGYYCAKSCGLCTPQSSFISAPKPAQKPAQAEVAPEEVTAPEVEEVPRQVPAQAETISEDIPEPVIEQTPEEVPAPSPSPAPAPARRQASRPRSPRPAAVVEEVAEEPEVEGPVAVDSLIQDRTAVADVLPSPLPRPTLIQEVKEDEEEEKEEPVVEESEEPELAIAINTDEAPELPTEEAIEPVPAVAVDEPIIEPTADAPVAVRPTQTEVEEPAQEPLLTRVPAPKEPEVVQPAPEDEDEKPALAAVPAPKLQTADEPAPEDVPEPVAATVTPAGTASRPSLKLTPEEENEAQTVAQTIASGTISIAVSLLTGLGKEGKSSSIAEGLALALEQSDVESVAEALSLVFSDDSAPEFFKDPINTALFLGGKPIADAIVLGMVLGVEQGETANVAAMLNAIINAGGQVNTLMEDSITETLAGDSCSTMQEVIAAAKDLAEVQVLSTALQSLLALEEITCGATTAATAPQVATVTPPPSIEAVVEATPTEQESIQIPPEVISSTADPVIPATPTTTTSSASEVDSALVQELAQSEGILSASTVFVEAIQDYTEGSDISSVTEAFQLSLDDGQRTELLALIVSVFAQLEDKELLGKALGAVAAEGSAEVRSVIAGGLAEVAREDGCEGLGQSLLMINNQTSIGGAGEEWAELVVEQGDVLVQCLGFDVKDCNQAASEDCCLGEDAAPEECHFCEFDLGCRYEKDPSSIESLGLLVYKDRFFTQFCKCPAASR
eukprot:TRINITY_DN1257_c0_g2_i3.p1 TRINITY_DN1257_c0_g2~~TRINITY_DN1257_c0_g2_i3.p1  ORF type:complete len:810 (-),score=173.24 TRINITY_DN1257_c0_g2_i3:389-2818(-)